MKGARITVAALSLSAAGLIGIAVSEGWEPVAKPPVVPVDAEIAGVDVMDMDSATQALWKENIYAETAMGCTGPVVRVQKDARDTAVEVLKKAGFL